MTASTIPAIDTSGIKSFRISFQRDVPAMAPPLFSIRSGGRDWYPEQLAIVGAAMNAGVFYDDDMQAVCRQPWIDAHPAQDVCLTRSTERCWIDVADDFSARRAMRETFDAQLKAGARGTWYAYRHARPADEDRPEHVSWHAAMADGAGGVHVVQSARLRDGVSFERVMEDMVRMEIYEAKHVEKHRRENIRSAELVQQHGWKGGDKLGDITISGTKYSSAVIEDIDTADGACTIRLTLAKRGSRKRWSWAGLAQSIQLSDQAHAEGVVGSVIVTDANTGDRVDLRNIA